MAGDLARHRDLPHLDGFRGLAAIAVVAFHLINTTAPVWFREGPPEVVSDALHHLGVNGVSAFFVLSGFLVARPFLDHVIDGRRLDLRRYVRARALRILPAWWLCLAVVLVISNRTLFDEPVHLVLLASLQHSYDPDLLRQVVPPAWSLVIEISFYAAMPVLLLSARRPLRRLGRPARIAAVATGLGVTVVAAVAFTTWWLAPGRVPHPDLRPLTFALPLWWDQFALGMLAALAVCAGRGAVGLARELRYASIVPILAAWEVFGDPAEHRNTLFAVGCAMLIAGLAGGPSGSIAGLLASSPLRRLGWWSYGIYLWHLPIQYALVQTGLIVHDRPSSTLLWLPVMLVAGTVAGWLSHRFVETPMLRRIDRPPGRWLARYGGPPRVEVRNG